MIVISRRGQLGPVEALELRADIASAAHDPSRHVLLDLASVDTLHPAVVAAIVDGAARVRQRAGTFGIVEPTNADALRTFDLVSLDTLIR